ncbi:TPA: Ger(x)C family spore germination protein [Bacillus cereus]|nr:Ger(x)C family spore germination protein [Bacillus cereus]
MKYLYSLFILLSIFSVFFSQGDKNELNRIAFSFALGIDYAKEGYDVSLQLINPAALSGEKPIKNSPYIVYHATGKTIDIALQRISVNMSRQLHLKQIQIVVIGEKLARERPIGKVTNYLIQSSYIPANALVVTTRNINAYQLLEIFSPVEGFSGLEITNTLQKLGKNMPKTANDIKIDLIQEGQDLTLPYIHLKGELDKGERQSNFETTKPTHIAYGGTALFKGEKLHSYLEQRDSLYLYLLKRKAANFPLEGTCPRENNQNFAFMVSNSYPKIADIKIINNEIIYTFDLRLSGTISQYNCQANLTDPNTIEKLNVQIEKSINNHVQYITNVSKNNGIDSLGLGLILEKYDSRKWNKVKTKWPSRIKQIKIKIKTHINVQNLGDFKVRGD